MKTRNGFVSNSSSSSFIVLFPHKPKSEEDLMAMMFPKWRADEVIRYYDINSMTLKQIVSRVYSDIMTKAQKDKYHANSLEDVTSGHSDIVDEDFRVKIIYDRLNGYEESSKTYRELVDKYNLHDNKWDGTWSKEIRRDPLYKKYCQEQRKEQKLEDEWRKERKKVVKEVVKDFRSNYKYHAYQHCFEYGDENEGEGLLEHGKIFRYLPHLKFCNH